MQRKNKHRSQVIRLLMLGIVSMFSKKLQPKAVSKGENKLPQLDEGDVMVTVDGMRMEMIDVPAEGNCAYAAIVASGKLGSGIDAEKLRKATFKWAVDYRAGLPFASALFEVLGVSKDTNLNLEQYLLQHSRIGEWANEFDLALVSKLFNTDIVVVMNVFPSQKQSSMDLINTMGNEFQMNSTETIHLFLHLFTQPTKPIAAYRHHELNHFALLV